MNGQIVVVVTKTDPASFNIAQNLLELSKWKDDGDYFSKGDHRLIIFHENLLYLQNLDELLAGLGLRPDVVIFASRHQSKDEKPRLCCHFTGNVGSATMGGNSRQLATAAPSYLKSFLSNLMKSGPQNFDICAEATHHGPTDLKTPSFFAEIGSTEKEWTNSQAGAAVANSIMSLERSQLPIFLGFGGGHYMQRQNQLLKACGIAFGHLFPNYQINELDQEMMKQACSKSGASYAYLDKNSLRSASKKKITPILNDLGLEIVKKNDIKKNFPFLDYSV